jgi:hypothetical protein
MTDGITTSDGEVMKVNTLRFIDLLKADAIDI